MGGASESLKFVLREAGISKHLPITHFLDSSTFELKSGQIGCVMEFQGIAFDTANMEELNRFKFLKHSVIAELDESFCLYEYILRHRLEMKLDGCFPDDFTVAIDRAYQSKFEKKNFYRNSLYLVLLYRGPGALIFKEKTGLFRGINARKNQLARSEYRTMRWISFTVWQGKC